jgi:predicted dehydrogenase
MKPMTFPAHSGGLRAPKAAPSRGHASLSRRRFLQQTASTVTAITLAPAAAVFGVEGNSPSGRPTLAGVGVGGVGFGQLQECEKAGFQIVALCDVDDAYAKKAFDRWPQARRYRDFREMLAADERIDAVHVGTPDHTHAVITLEALRRRKHVCCVKPLTRTLEESRAVVATATGSGVATQVTAAPNTGEAACRTCEWIGAGALGAVREVHIWTNRPVWPQGVTRPAGEDPLPKSLDWDLWIGPAPMRPFKNEWPKDHVARVQMKSMESWFEGYLGVYHPFNFRGWWDFGTGALGDMGCHHFNTVYRALRLVQPNAIQATATKVYEETAPLASIVTYDYPARGDLAPVRMVWYDGGLKPPAPRELGQEPLPAEGTLYVGDDGALLYSWDNLKVLPAKKQSVLEQMPKSLPRREGTWKEWMEAVKGGEKAGCHFEWAGLLNDAVLLGNVAIRVGKPLAWDGGARRFTNNEKANDLRHGAYRNGWAL